MLLVLTCSSAGLLVYSSSKGDRQSIPVEKCKNVKCCSKYNGAGDTTPLDIISHNLFQPGV